MNSNEVEKIKEGFSKIEELDIAKLISESYPGEKLDKVDIDGINATQLLSLIKRVITHFNYALDEDPFVFPKTFPSWKCDGNNYNIPGAIPDLYKNITTKQWSTVVDQVIWLARCLMFCNYWGKTTKRAHSVYEKKASDLLSESELKLAEIKFTINTLTNEQEALQKQVKDSRRELQEITEELESARSDREQINEFLTQASSDHGKISQIVKTQAENLREIEAQIKRGNNDQTRIDDMLKKAATFYEKAEGDSQWIESKRNEINQLTSRAADGSLGGTFKARKEELESSSRTWKWISAISAVSVALYIIAVFLWIPSPQSHGGLAILANLGKIAPALLFLIFVLRQYSRERSFLEEYAFKASVAFVVNAYADQIASSRFDKTLADFDENQERWEQYLKEREDDKKKLIRETVNRLFTPPQIHAEKSPSLVAFRPKAAADILREARELLDEAKKS
jgi:uncharacterized membrane protein